jgi:hypothetical protein
MKLIGIPRAAGDTPSVTHCHAVEGSRRWLGVRGHKPHSLADQVSLRPAGAHGRVAQALYVAEI